MITLSDKKPFAFGGHRTVYIHPHDENKCIKILHNYRHGDIVRTSHKFPRNLRSAAHYDDNQREKNGYRYIDAMAKKHDVYKHIPHYYGIVETDAGSGSVTQLMRDYDGSISKTLRQRVQQTAADTQYTDSINELKEFIQTTLLLTRKLTLQNILSVRLSEQQERLYLIEGFGAQEFIPLVRYIPAVKKSKIRRTLQWFDRRIAAERALAQ